MKQTIETLYSIFLEHPILSTDTRKIEKGSIFFALKGSNFDGNTFAKEAIQMGAEYAVVDDVTLEQEDKMLYVENVLSALQVLGLHHRRQLNIPVLAITGSNGKTTTKELIHAVLSTTYKTFATKGNLNNHIGVPLTLLSLTKDTEIAVVEMGANHQKEIESYCSYTEPNYGIITNIGKAHLEGFGGIEGVKKGKGELYQYLNQNGGKVFIYSNNEVLKSITTLHDPIYYGSPGDFYSARYIDSNPMVRLEAENGDLVQSQLTGSYNYENILAALCIGKFFKVDPIKANKAIQDYVPSNHRSQLKVTDKNQLIVDCYNANPTSMRLAIENFNSSEFSKKAVILGDMYELGEESVAEHAAIGVYLKECNFNVIFLCGEKMQEAYNYCPQAIYLPNKEKLMERLVQEELNGFAILIKGSRGMGLEFIVPFL